jgi:hypothetical protein
MRSLTPSLPPRLTAPAWDFASAARLSNRMVAACGLPTTLRVAQVFVSPCPPKPRQMNDTRSRSRSDRHSRLDAIFRSAQGQHWRSFLDESLLRSYSRRYISHKRKVQECEPQNSQRRLKNLCGSRSEVWTKLGTLCRAHRQPGGTTLVVEKREIRLRSPTQALALTDETMSSIE